MKREFLKSLNLEDLVIDQIMLQNGVDSIKQENESYKTQIVE